MKSKNSFLAAFTLVLIFSAFLMNSQKPTSAATPTPPPPDKQDAKIAADVRAVLDAQVAAWNHGDIDAFMDGYWRSTATAFVSGDHVTRGWQTVMDHYKKSYDSREKMGTLAFTELEITPLGKDAASALGRWQLTRAKDTPHGYFTLLFRRTPQGWRIVQDHTSSAT
jgi:beta-aspartyl-peptidase (threonine type)